MILPYAIVLGGMSIVRSLAEARLPIILGSDARNASVIYSRYPRRTIFFSHYDSASFIDELCALGESLDEHAVLFSDDDRAIHAISRYRDRLSPYFRFMYPSHEIVDGLLDKRRFAGLAGELGLPVPRTAVPRTIEELDIAAGTMTYPCILKPAHKEDWWSPEFVARVGSYRKVISCASREEILHAYRKVSEIGPEVILQELVVGRDDQLYSSNLYYNASGKLDGYFAGHKKRSYPIHAGIGSLIETVDSDEVMRLSTCAAEKLGMRGYYNIQYKRDVRTGELKILEIHVRNSSWGYLGTAAGVNMPAIGYCDMTGRAYNGARVPRPGVKFIDIKRDIKAFRAYRKTGEWTLGAWLGSLRGKRVYDLLSWRDPLPFFMDVWLSIKRKI